MKTGILFILATLIILTLSIMGCTKPEKKEVGYNITACEKLCNQTYTNTSNQLDQLQACWSSCRSSGTKGNAYYDYMDNLNELKGEEIS